MIENNFRVLLARKKKKMSDVISDTGLSKVTVRNLYYETSKGVQFETLEVICKYLDCGIGDILVYKKDVVA